jgi:hypothetical protein
MVWAGIFGMFAPALGCASQWSLVMFLWLRSVSICCCSLAWFCFVKTSPIFSLYFYHLLPESFAQVTVSGTSPQPTDIVKGRRADPWLTSFTSALTQPTTASWLPAGWFISSPECLFHLFRPNMAKPFDPFASWVSWVAIFANPLWSWLPSYWMLSNRMSR